MREALLQIGSAYSELVGTSKIFLLFVISILALILINENEENDHERRRINPTVFLLSLWSGISYAIVKIVSSKKRSVYILGLLFSAVMIALSGTFVISTEAYEASIYFGSSKTIIVLSVICILIYITIYYLISRQLFKDRVDRLTFLLVIIWLHLFDFYSEKAAVISLSLSPITVGSIIIHDILPILLWLYLMYEDKIKTYFAETDEIHEGTQTEDIPEEWDMKKHKILNIRNMAIAFAALLILFIGSVFVLNNKINSLYDATVILEKAAKSKMTVYELEDSDGNVILTVMESPDKNITVIGGGSRSDGEKICEFIKEYTNNVDKWYLYGYEEEYKGAFDHCIENGVKVSETYIVSGIEKVQ